MNAANIEQKVQRMRAFNRFYTEKMGLLTNHFLDTRFTLTQARILFELAYHQETTATRLIQELHIDPGHLSRILGTFEKDGLIRRSKSESDSRQRIVKLTSAGKKEFNILNERSSNEIKQLLEDLSIENRDRLIGATDTIEEILNPTTESSSAFFLRTENPGDIGWMIYRHGILYWDEYKWDESFEALVADILVEYTKNHNPEKERIWIAEQNGERVGCIMLVDAGDGIAKLRLLLVDPSARGQGLGNRLIQDCIDFARHKGYHKITLWTNSVLVEARHLYRKAGFKIVEETPHHSFGHNLVAEVWELKL